MLTKSTAKASCFSHKELSFITAQGWKDTTNSLSNEHSETKLNHPTYFSGRGYGGRFRPVISRFRKADLSRRASRLECPMTHPSGSPSPAQAGPLIDNVNR
jgi:hypothetical protein